MNLVRRFRFASRRGPSLALLLPSLLATGCGGLHLEQYAEATPHFDPFTFFPGQTRAWGIVQDWRGRVVRRFEVDINGRVEHGTLTLDEALRYADGERSTRRWQITRNADGALSGTADDIVDAAEGASAGNSMYWRYSMDLAVGDNTYRVRFDDWMWQLDERVLVNRSYLRKFGLTVAEVTLFMQKQDG